MYVKDLIRKDAAREMAAQISLPTARYSILLYCY